MTTAKQFNVRETDKRLRKLRWLVEELSAVIHVGFEKVLEGIEETYNDLKNDMEGLEIETEDARTNPKEWMGFTLTAGKWSPCKVMNRTKPGWVEWAVENSDGTSDCGVSYLFHWADCTADGNPSLPTFQEWIAME